MRLALPDGTKVTCTYNTRVTSEVRGKVVVQRPDNSEIVATDSPQVDSCQVTNEYSQKKGSQHTQRGMLLLSFQMQCLCLFNTIFLILFLNQDYFQAPWCVARWRVCWKWPNGWGPCRSSSSSSGGKQSRQQ